MLSVISVVPQLRLTLIHSPSFIHTVRPAGLARIGRAPPLPMPFLFSRLVFVHQRRTEEGQVVGNDGREYIQ